DDDYCKPQWNWSFTDRCDYVLSSEACGGGGYLQWTSYVYCCEDDVGKWLIVAAGVIFLFILFLMLSTSADDFFCPNISTIVNKLAISENLAGVTFLAFGNGAPDVFTSLASVVTSPLPRADLALGGLLGGAIFVTLIVLSGVVLMRPFKAAVFSSLRDLGFFLFSMCFILLFFLVSDEVQLWQPLGCLGIYAVYVLTVVTTEIIKKHARRREEDTAARKNSCVGSPQLSTTTTTGLRPLKRTDALRTSNVSRRSVVISSFSGNAHELVIEDSCEDADEELEATGGGFIDTHHESAQNHKRLISATKGVVANLLAYYAPQFEEEEPSRFQRVKTYILWPIVTIFKLTVPLSTVDWCRPAAIVLAVLSPLMFIVNTQLIYTKPVEGGPGLYAYSPIVSIPLIAFILLATSAEKEPRFYKISFSLLGFVMSVSWMYAISNEVVDAVTMIGVVTGIDQAILGLTVIAWANCVGDLVSDSSVARQGFPRMGMAAATGGPLFNVLIGFGLPFTIAKIKGDTVPFQLSLEGSSLVMVTFMFISLIFTSVNLIIFRGHFRRIYGFLLIAIYIAFLVFVILSSTGVLPWIKS
ncbi:hypothetical protein PMAYCL1PPCAC_16042, partial [Pristionchus mayeri]